MQGHADIDDDADYNLKLASERAMRVYKYLQTDVGIDQLAT